MVRAAGDPSSPAGQDALQRLCRTYWYPLYTFIRRLGYDAADAQDLTQEFFARLLAKEFLHGVDPGKGKFRSFLLAALNHFLSKERRRARAQKRGGGVQWLPLPDDSAQQQYLQVPAAGLSPEQVFEQQWATTLLNQVLSRLQAEYVARGKGESFEELKTFLTGEKQAAPYAAVALRLGTTEAALKMAVSRLRRRYGELLRATVAETVTGPEEVEDELRALFAALSL